MDRISSLESEIAEIRKNLYKKENELYELKKKWFSQPNPSQIELYGSKDNIQLYGAGAGDCPKSVVGEKLPKWAIERYSRQILLPDIGVSGQVKICSAKVLVVGAGGLGCPVASYLAGAGVGEIGVVDYDTVDVTNIHRQLLHGESEQYMNKVDSAANALRRINSHITVTPHNLQLDSTNALHIVSKYNLVLDCTDNVPGRYLLNDACQLMQVPLISGSALKMEGQLTIYNYKVYKNTNDKEAAYSGPCYRCLFETPPPPETVGSCSANGVCGPVPGVIGCLQALEAIKLIVGLPHTKLLVGRMLIFDGEDMTFRVVKLRPKNPNCAACSDTPTITQLLDYETFCRTRAKEKDLDLKILPPEHRVTPEQLADKLKTQRHLLFDVRSEPEFQMCHIDSAVNFPVEKIKCKMEFDKLLQDVEKQLRKGGDVTFVCRRGNDSQLVTKRVLDMLPATDTRGANNLPAAGAGGNNVIPRASSSGINNTLPATDTGGINDLLPDSATGESHTLPATGTAGDNHTLPGISTGKVNDLVGGLHAWAHRVDQAFPIY